MFVLLKQTKNVINSLSSLFFEINILKLKSNRNIQIVIEFKKLNDRNITNSED